MTWPAVHISQSINAAPHVVANFAGDPANLPQWAAGLSNGIRHEDGRWLTDSPMGAVEVRFVGPVEHGILDHDVVLPGGSVTHNPLRVLRNDTGSEVVFTLFRGPQGTADDFEGDAAAVKADLSRLKGLLDGAAPNGTIA
ncbi:SRPBCC family protein [Kocuria sp. JC486]|uniref:SRPBCC family protein n=1 Tax=Kocuria sp. JC486 TaxID=1970736 RepID=UPI00141EC4EA|nr:SRPBCC family protein [Kocuria sp. JC486]NHU86069.1 SRPBCC family protein [Kocuria sp. JC486]